MAGSLFLYVSFIAPSQAMRAAEDWEEIPCVVISSKLVEHVSRTTETGGHDHTKFHEIEVEFRYQYQGNEYTSDRYDLSDVSSGEKDWKQEVVDELGTGTETVCYVNPEDPKQAVLTREFTLSPFGAIPPALFVLVGLAGMAMVVSVFFDSRRRRGVSSS